MDLLPVSLRDSASSDRHVLHLQPRAHVPHHRVDVCAFKLGGACQG